MRGMRHQPPVLQDSLKPHAAPHKCLRAVAFADKLPRTQAGKLQRFKLREHPPFA